MSEPTDVSPIEAAANALEVIDLSDFSAQTGPPAQEAPAAAPEAAPEPADAQPDAPEADLAPEPEAPTGEPEEASEPEAGASASEAEGEPEAKDTVPNYKWEEYRRKSARLQRELAEVDALKHSLQQARLDAEKAREGLSDPQAVIREYVKASGKSEDELFNAWAQERIQRMERGEPAERQPTRAEIEQEVREQLAREKAEAARREHQESLQGVSEQIARYRRAALEIPYTEELAKELPHLASLEDAELGAKVEFGVKWAMENAPQATFKEVLAELDKIVKSDYDAKQQRLARWKAPSAPDPKPDEGKTSPPQPGRQLTNRDSATSNGGPPVLETREQRLAAAGNALEVINLDGF